MNAAPISDVVLKDCYGNYMLRVPIDDALLLEAQEKVYRTLTPNGKLQFRYKEPAGAAKPSPCTVVSADIQALERTWDGMKINRERWERLAGFGFVVSPELCSQV